MANLFRLKFGPDSTSHHYCFAFVIKFREPEVIWLLCFACVGMGTERGKILNWKVPLNKYFASY